jgi:hypothetical protein
LKDTAVAAQACFSNSVADSDGFEDEPIACRMMLARISARCFKHRSKIAVQSSGRRMAMLSGQ